VSKTLRCVACRRRIRPHHPYYGVEVLKTSREYRYHAHGACEAAAVGKAAHLMERGGMHIFHHYHSYPIEGED